MNRSSCRLLTAVAALLFAVSPAHAQDVRSVVEDVARSWSRGDVGSIAAFGARTGIAVEIDGDRHGVLNPRQASAALRRVFDERETVQVKPGMAKVVDGSPERAFGEVQWTTRVRGTTQPQRITVFFAFVLENERWRITEIRVLR